MCSNLLSVIPTAKRVILQITMYILKLEIAHKGAVCIGEKGWGGSETVAAEKWRYWNEELQFHCDGLQ